MVPDPFFGQNKIVFLLIVCSLIPRALLKEYCFETVGNVLKNADNRVIISI